MTATATDPWIPASQQELESFQRSIVGHLMRRAPTVPKKFWEDTVPDVFADGYAEYLEVAGDPEQEIIDSKGFLAALCVRRGLDNMRNTARRDARYEIRPDVGTSDDPDGTRMEQSLDDAMMRDPGLVEKFAPASQAVKNDQRNVMLTTLAALPPGQRDAFRRCILQDQSQVDAAKEIGIGIKPFERRLKKAVSQVAWAVTQTSQDSMCDEYQAMTAGLSDPANPNREKQSAILKHVQGCSSCRAAIYESPLGINGLGLLLGTGAFSTQQGTSLGEKISSLPIIDGPATAAKSLWDKITPGSHAAEAAVGGGTAAGGTGGTILAVGGGKAIMSICAGVAATACVAGVSTGVIPIAKSTTEKPQSPAKTAAAEPLLGESEPVTADSRAIYENHRAKVERTIAKRQARREAKKEAEQKAAEAKAVAASSSSESEGTQASYSSPVSTAPTTQAETNESSASQSLGVATAPTSTSSSSSSSGGSSAAQTQTNQAAANDSFGIGN